MLSLKDKDLTLKAVFLVAICSACRILELQALSCRAPFLLITKEKVILRPVLSFLLKVVSSFHLNQTITLPAFSASGLDSESGKLWLLDIHQTLRRYLKRTLEFRRSDYLFRRLCKGKAESKTSIAR